MEGALLALQNYDQAGIAPGEELLKAAAQEAAQSSTAQIHSLCADPTNPMRAKILTRTFKSDGTVTCSYSNEMPRLEAEGDIRCDQSGFPAVYKARFPQDLAATHANMHSKYNDPANSPIASAHANIVQQMQAKGMGTKCAPSTPTTKPGAPIPTKG